jgi:TetR/AcrR family transcriptional regulator, regulator of cefoperazone and chloramphenicol sensitivity
LDSMFRLTISNICFKQLFDMSRHAVTEIVPPRRRRTADNASELTRNKLIEAALHVFAERGYRSATIREICRRAGANVAAVNYTFGDKMGLYTEVLRHSVRMAQTPAMTAALDDSVSPEDTIRGVIRARLMSLCQEARPDLHLRLVMHEFSHPTAAMARVVDEGIRPVYDRVRIAVGKMIGLSPDHETTRLCVNSIVGQFLFYTFSRPVLARLQPELKLTPDQVDRIADHIANFSLAYLKKVGQGKSHG